jgi:hypothetical protein
LLNPDLVLDKGFVKKNFEKFRKWKLHYFFFASFHYGTVYLNFKRGLQTPEKASCSLKEAIFFFFLFWPSDAFRIRIQNLLKYRH